MLLHGVIYGKHVLIYRGFDGGTQSAGKALKDT
jgi:hypothetical protein